MLIKLRCDRQNLIHTAALGETSGAAILDAVLALEFALTLGSVRQIQHHSKRRLPNSIRNLIAFPQRYSQQ